MKHSISSLAATVACLMAACLPALAAAPAPSPSPEPGTILLIAGAGGALLVAHQLRRKK
jgi:hypothetical protein